MHDSSLSVNYTIILRDILPCVGTHTGLLHAGDVVHEINGTVIRGLSADQVADLMAGLQGMVVFKITPAISDCRPKRRTQVCVWEKNLYIEHMKVVL